MKVVILAGGLPSAISDIYEGIPKPMAEIGEKPILWHIMKNFSARGFSDFIICGGYKVNLIKDYFLDYYVYQSDITVDLLANTVEIHKKITENWNVTVVDTGLSVAPAQRIQQIREYLNDEDFIVVHGDCLSDIDYGSLVDHHIRSGKIATVAMARPTGRNVVFSITEEGLIMKNATADLPENQSWVNACCEVFTKDVFDYLCEKSDLGQDLFGSLAEDNQIMAYKHNGFWTPIETKREQTMLDNLWKSNKAPWMIW